MPSKPSWLNDLSSKPPASETMQGRKSSAAGGLLRRCRLRSLLSGASPQPARAAVASSATRPLATTFLDSSQMPPGSLNPGIEPSGPAERCRANGACPRRLREDHCAKRLPSRDLCGRRPGAKLRPVDWEGLRPPRRSPSRSMQRAYAPYSQLPGRRGRRSSTTAGSWSAATSRTRRTASALCAECGLVSAAARHRRRAAGRASSCVDEHGERADAVRALPPAAVGARRPGAACVLTPLGGVDHDRGAARTPSGPTTSTH